MTLSILFYALMSLTVVALAGAFVVELVRERAPRTRPVRAVAQPSRQDHARYGARTADPSHG